MVECRGVGEIRIPPREEQIHEWVRAGFHADIAELWAITCTPKPGVRVVCRNEVHQSERGLRKGDISSIGVPSRSMRVLSVVGVYCGSHRLFEQLSFQGSYGWGQTQESERQCRRTDFILQLLYFLHRIRVWSEGEAVDGVVGTLRFARVAMYLVSARASVNTKDDVRVTNRCWNAHKSLPGPINGQSGAAGQRMGDFLQVVQWGRAASQRCRRSLADLRVKGNTKLTSFLFLHDLHAYKMGQWRCIAERR